MAFTVVADIVLRSLGTPSVSEGFPVIEILGGTKWNLYLAMPGPGHPGLLEKAAVGFMTFGPTGTPGQVLSDYRTPGAGVIGLNTRSHIVASQRDDGLADIFVNGSPADADPHPIPQVGPDDLTPAIWLRPGRMAVAPQVDIKDVRTYVEAFTVEHARADMNKPIPGWFWRLSNPWPLFLMVLVGAFIISGAKKSK